MSPANHCYHIIIYGVKQNIVSTLAFNITLCKFVDIFRSE